LYCEECGAKIDNAKFCPSCGKDTSAQASKDGKQYDNRSQGQQYVHPDYQQTEYRQNAYTQRQTGYAGENNTTRKPITCLILIIITCGIYFLYWTWVTSKQINQLAGKEIASGGLLILSWFCLPVSFYIWYKWDKALQDIGAQYGVRYSSNFVLWVALSFLGGIGSIFMLFQVQDTLNDIYAK
jgi:magnesium-transporting ATPase (P-type)